MSRVCQCVPIRAVPGQRFVQGRDCVWCWRWLHVPEHRAARGGNPADCAPSPAPQRYPTPGTKPKAKAKGKCGCKGVEPEMSVPELLAAFRGTRIICRGCAELYHLNQTAAVHRIVDDLRTALPAVPSFQHERGIVTSGGGAYWPGTWVTASILRELGWKHPIQAWFIGERERDAAWIGRLQALGVECVDAEAVRKRHPYRVLNGFEVKLYAVMHSGIREPLWLDSDCYPCRDPNVLYECSGYQRTGAVWYPDMANADPWTKWDCWGVAADDSPPIETGQYLLDLRRVWEEASIALKLNELSDVTYHWDYGDKGPARVAWAWTRRDRTIYQRVPQWSGPAFVHPAHDGKPLFIHRCRGKVAPSKAKFYTPQNTNGQLPHRTLPGEKLYQHYAIRAKALQAQDS